MVEEQGDAESDLSPTLGKFRITRRHSKQLSSRLNEADRGLIKLDFSHLPLYGRFQEKLSMINTLRRVGMKGAAAEVLMLFGKSGTGKTALVRESLQDFNETYFLGRGKFDSVAHGPFSTIVEAFAELIMSMIDHMGKDGLDYATAVSEALGDEAYRITSLIPELVDLIGERPPNEDQQQAPVDYTTFRRFLNLVRCMLRAMCSFGKLVVLWFDDLHVADADSLKLFKYIANDSETRNLLVIGSFEDRKRCGIDAVTDLLGEIEQVKTTLIHLENLSQASITSLLADVMATDRDATKSLARAIFKRAKGNPFFAIQFLELIQELGLLQFDVKSHVWIWDLRIITEATSVLSTVANSFEKAQFSVLARLSHLPYTSKMILSTAASLGSSRFDIKVLAWLLKDKKLSLDDIPSRQQSRTLDARPFMQAMMSSLRGFERLGDPEHEVRETLVALERVGMVEGLGINIYRFAHDMILEGAYLLLPGEDVRTKKHWKTGQYLKQLLDKRVLEDDRLFFTMVDQLNRGSTSGLDEEDRLELSSLNLRAAYKATERSAFDCAVQYVRTGTAYLGDSRWETNYVLAMKLEMLAAVTAFASGDNEGCLLATDKAIRHSMTLQQKIPAFVLRIKAFARLGKHGEALDCTIEALELLGEKFVSKPRAAHLATIQHHAKLLLKERTDECLLDIRVATDISIVTILEVLNLAVRCITVQDSRDFVSTVKCRMLELAVTHGVCDESVVAYTGFGTLLATTRSDHDDAFRAGIIGVQLQQLLNSPKYEARVAFEFFVYAHHLKQPIRHSLGPLYQSFRKGLRYGVIEDALMAASAHCLHFFFSGRPLVSLASFMHECTSLLVEYMPSFHRSMIAFGQLVDNLMSKAPNRLVLNGRVMDLEDTLHKIECDNDVPAHRMLLCAQIELACWFQQHGVAYSRLQELAKLPQDDYFISTFTARRLVFFEGLVNVELSRSLDKSGAANLRHAREKAKILREYAQEGAVDCLELSQLLQAEILSRDGRTSVDDIKCAYHTAIASSVRSGTHQNVALANELAGHYCLSLHEHNEAMIFLHNARQSYFEWNATEKIQNLEESFPELGFDLDSSFEPVGLHPIMQSSDISTKSAEHRGSVYKESI